MKRRNVDCGKIRRPVKRNKITEGIYGSTLMYLKFLIIWVIVILADFLLEFRFEFLWPFWLLLRSVYDSFKYQGLAFSVFFICIAVTSDMVCFFFIPVQWLFFAASTYVWVQYVWHTDKGICMPTIILWILFVYMEAAVRLRDMRHLPFHLDLCRPFAAHCIGYPVVTLGFGFKSYVGYRMRQRKQKDVAKENEFYAQLLQQALPIEQTGAQQASATTQTETVTQPVNSGGGGGKQQQQTSNRTQPSSDKSRTSETHNSSVTSNGTVQNGTIPQTSNTKNNHRKSVDKINDHNKHKEHNENHINTDKTNSSSDNKRYIHANGSVNHDSDFVERNVNELDEADVEKEKVVKTVVQNKSNKYDRKENSNQNCQRKNKEKHKDALQAEREKEAEYMQRLEWDVKRLRADLQASRGTELELRSQVNSLTNAEKNVRTELSQLQHDHEELQNKLQNVASARAAERQALERRAAEDRRTRAALEVQLAHERRSQQQAQHQHNKGECTEQCRQRRRELENEVRELRSTVRAAEERLGTAERERTQQQHDTDILMSALSAMQDKNQHLEDSLSAETRIKLDLFSALGEAKRQLEIRENVIRSQEKEIEELKSKIAQVLAVMPSDTFGSPTPSSSSSRVRLAESPPVSVATPQSGASSTLDPNATAYTPKGSLVAGTEA